MRASSPLVMSGAVVRFTGGIRRLLMLRDPEPNSPVACSRSLPAEALFALLCLFHVLCCVHWFVCVAKGLLFLSRRFTFCIGGPSRLPAGLELKAYFNSYALIVVVMRFYASIGCG